jgi:hypothetical protein
MRKPFVTLGLVAFVVIAFWSEGMQRAADDARKRRDQQAAKLRAAKREHGGVNCPTCGRLWI